MTAQVSGYFVAFVMCVCLLCHQISALHKYEDLLSKISAEAAHRLMPIVSACVNVYFTSCLDCVV